MQSSDMSVPIRPPELMNGQFKDFIGVWDNFVPKIHCEAAISRIDEYLDTSASAKYLAMTGDHASDGSNQFADSNIGRNDFALFLSYHDGELAAIFNQYLQACLLDYIERFGNLKHHSLISTDSKLQRTPPQGGYHVWHAEDSVWRMQERVLVWAIYLNDLPEGEGETEYLYQSRRVQPKIGRVVIWPAGFTHVHRGNPPYSKNKYILTGWYINMPKVS